MRRTLPYREMTRIPTTMDIRMRMSFPAAPIRCLPDPNPDRDNDGLADAWEVLHFGNITAQNGDGDPDGDGTSNRTEQCLGLDPENGTSRFSAAISGMQITWPGVEGVTFAIQRSTAIGSWVEIFTQNGVNGINSFTDPAPPPARRSIG
jgi:hypothetical protein